MRRTVGIVGTAAVLMLALPLWALAQSGSGAASSGAQAKAEGSANANLNANAEARAAVTAEAAAVREKGAKVSAKSRADAEAKLKAEADKVEGEAQGEGEAKVAARLASEFGMTAQALMDERQQLDASWGNLMIAHTLEANAKTDLTVEQMMALHAEGTGWGQIAAGLGLKLGECVSAVQSEGRVASGRSRADGRVAVIHGEGARAGLNAGLGLGHGRADVGAGAAAGVKVPKIGVGGGR
jgi:colicin import membrane protein